MKKILVLLLLTFPALHATTLRAQWKQCSGPYSGSVFGIVFNGNSEIAATSGGMYKSTDYGVHWTRVHFDSLFRSVSMVGMRDNLFAATEEGHILKSSDNGTNWIESDSGLDFYADSLSHKVSVFACDGSILYAGNSRLFISLDQGGHWRLMGTLPAGPFSTNNSKLFVRANEGVYRSLDTGRTWKLMSDQAGILSLSFSGQTLVGLIGNNVLVSNDDAEHWSHSSVNFFYITTGITSVGSDLYFAYEKGIAHSTDAGVSWRTSESGIEGEYVYEIIIADSVLLAGTYTGVYRSFDKGSHWHRSSEGMDIIVPKINAMSSFGSQVLTGSRDYGLLGSSDNGSTWQNVMNNGFLPVVTLLAQNASEIVFGTLSTGLFVSTDQGISWQGSSSLAGIPMVALSDSTIYGLGDYSVITLDRNAKVISSFAPTARFLFSSIAAFGSTVIVATDLGVFRSTNRGSEWSSTDTGRDVVRLDNLFAIHGLLFGSEKMGGVFQSADSGRTWSVADSGLPLTGLPLIELRGFAASGNNVFLATSMGVFLCSDRGNSWISVSRGLSDSDVVAITSTSSFLIASTRTQGVWRRDLSEIISPASVTSEEEEFPSKIRLHQNYPNPFAGVTELNFVLSEPGEAELGVADILGRKLRSMQYRGLNAGVHTAMVNSEGLANGVYTATFTFGSYTRKIKIVVKK